MAMSADHTIMPNMQQQHTFRSLLVFLVHGLQPLVYALSGEWDLSEEGSHHFGLLLSSKLDLLKLSPGYKASDY